MVVTILECCVTFSGVKLSIRSFVLFITCLLGDKDNTDHLIGHMEKYFLGLLQVLVNWDENVRINTDKDLSLHLHRLLVRILA